MKIQKGGPTTKTFRTWVLIFSEHVFQIDVYTQFIKGLFRKRVSQLGTHDLQYEIICSYLSYTRFQKTWSDVIELHTLPGVVFDNTHHT